MQLLKIGNIIAVIFALILNGLANALPINGRNTGEISDSIPNLFVPAGITFSIWGVIYFFLVVFSVYQSKKGDQPYLERLGPWLMIANLANGLWILFWHYGLYAISLITMLVLLGALLKSYLNLDIGKTEISTAEKFAVNATISVYLGWISVATIANFTAVLVDASWNGGGISESNWTIVVIIIAVLLTSGMILIRQDYVYSLVIIWSLIGIIIKRSDLAFPPQPGIIITTSVGLAIIILLDLLVWFKEHRSK